ncbi:amino acid transporter [Rhodoblastus sphagnicola]|uniref:hypothetical protein n=1 Tax=Rhodoblastus sphagnicola TaxID=333368 RepID=UPI0011B04385|nr:hypothetical protein [Rhodoblastus sphagnicola]MBB4196627.1 amino acid transporter [Rhodoblastus sphagnicola]
MTRWIRLIVSILALVGLMASTAAVARPHPGGHVHYAQASAQPSSAHSCCPNQPEPSPDHSGAPDCCLAGLCACVASAFAPPLALNQKAPAFVTAVRPPPRASRLASLSRPPDPRPPKA